MKNYEERVKELKEEIEEEVFLLNDLDNKCINILKTYHQFLDMM